METPNFRLGEVVPATAQTTVQVGMRVRRPGVRMVTLLAIASAATTVAEVNGTTERPLRSFPDDAMVELGFDPAQKVDLDGGTVLSVGLADIERQPNELTVGVVMMLVRRPLDVVAEALVSDASFRVNTDILDYRAIGDGTESREEIKAIFRGVGYTEQESAEAAKLLRVKPGSQFNLSNGEITEFRSIDAAEGAERELVSATMADVLRQRFLAYLGGGLDSVEPYARGGRKRASPRRELTVAFSALELLERHFPTFYTSLLRFPERLPGDTISRFYWIKRRFGGRPTFVLVHRLEQHRDEYTIAVELQFFVGHSYNSMLSLIACVPKGESTLVLSINRFFTDQVTGVGSGLKKKIGRRQVVAAVAEHFEELRGELERRGENEQSPLKSP